MQIRDQKPRVFDGAFADLERGYELRVRVHRYEDPLISDLALAVFHAALLLLNESPNLIALNVAAAKVAQPRVQQPFTAGSQHFEQSQDRVSIETREPFRAADRADLDKTLDRPCRRVCAGSHRAKGRLGLRLAESSFTGIAAPALDSTLAIGAEALTDIVLASGAGHGFSPLDSCAELSHNHFGSGLRLTPRSGLAPQPA